MTEFIELPAGWFSNEVKGLEVTSTGVSFALMVGTLDYLLQITYFMFRKVTTNKN